MKATVTKAFPGRPDNEVMTREIKVGEIIDGDLAAVAIKEKWAKSHRDDEEIAAAEAAAKAEAEKNAAKEPGKVEPDKTDK